MNIALVTQVRGIPPNLTGHTQYFQHLEVDVFQRTPRETQLRSNSFTTDEGATWNGERLRVHFLGVLGRYDLPMINLDLTWHPGTQTFSGFFERSDFKGQVVLKRPQNAQANPFIGTWFNSRTSNCLHIAQGRDGAFAAWLDLISIPGQMRYANHIKPPTNSTERYGEHAEAEQVSPHGLAVQLGSNAVCCPRRFVATISADERNLLGDWPAGLNVAPRPVEWTKQPADSCLKVASNSH